MEARPLLNVPVLKNLRELRPYHTQDQFSLPSVTRLTISVLRISLNFSFLSSVYLAMYCYFKDKLVIAHLYFGRVFVQVFSPIQ